MSETRQPQPATSFQSAKSPTVILQPSSRPGLPRPYSPERLRAYVDEASLAALKDAAGGRDIIVWGKPKRVLRLWQQVAKDDVALFSHRKRIFAMARVADTLRNATMASELTEPGFSDEVQELLIIYSKVETLDIPVEELNKVIGYAHEAHLRQFTLLSKERSRRVLSYLSRQDKN